MALKVPPLAQVLISALMMALCRHLFPGWQAHLPFGREFAALFLLAGLSVMFLGVAHFRQAKTTVNPFSPEDTSALVTIGIYRYTRNPMYLGMLLLLFGWWFWLHNLVAAIFLPLFVLTMNGLQIVPEERILREKFGEDYSAYLAAVPRWLF